MTSFIATTGCLVWWANGCVQPGMGSRLYICFTHLGHMKNAIARGEGERAPAARLELETHIVHIADRLIAATPSEESPTDRALRCGPDAHCHCIAGRRSGSLSAHGTRAGHVCRSVSRPHRKNILFAGRIEPLKGIDTLLRALALLQALEPAAMENVCVTIVGGDPWTPVPESEMARLQTMSESLGLHDLVAFAGARDQELLPFYFAAAEMVVVPSHYESFGMVALESMAMGTPVIASRVGGLAHLVIDGFNGYLVLGGR